MHPAAYENVAQTGAERILGSFGGESLGFLTYIVGRTFWDPNMRGDGALLAMCLFIHHACKRPICITLHAAISARKLHDVVHQPKCR